VAQRQDRERRKATGRSGVYRVYTFVSRLWTCQEVEDENDDEDGNDWGRKEAGKATEEMVAWFQRRL
jgi:hypothetical protein